MRRTRNWFRLLLVVGAAWGCGSDDVYWFTGRVYDGATGARLTNYSVRLQYRDITEEGEVDSAGRYVVGPLLPYADYSVEVTAPGYRTFLSHNEFRAPAPSPSESLYFDAYVFPNSVQASSMRVIVSVSDSDAPPTTGAVRLQPTSGSALYRDVAQTPAGVGGGAQRQVWTNDEDLQFRTVTRPIQNGVAQFDAGTLVYGVTYAVTVFGVANHQDGSAIYRAGLDADRPVVLHPYETTELSLAFNSASLGVVPSGELALVMNQPIQLDPTQTDASALRALDMGLRIDSGDGNGNGLVNRLRDDTPAAIDRGVGFQVTGSRVVLRWDRSNALATSDAADPIWNVTFGGLDTIRIRSISGGPSTSRTLAQLVGASSVTLRLQQE